ncbi:LacI family DNA-binding transcriptional regulator [Lachnospiraceae bacterium 62-35]
MKKVTSTDVAHLAGVSQATVSMVLNNKVGPSFSEETKNRVLDAARQLGYILPAQNPTAADKNLIAVFIPTLSNPFYTQLTSFIEKYALSQGCKILLCNTSRNREFESYYLDYFAKSRVAGIIFTFVPSYPQLVEQLSLSMPIVLIGEKTENLTIPSIELNNIKAGIIMGEYLLSMKHTHFAFFSTPFNNVSLARHQRLEGLKLALKEAGLENNLSIFAGDYLAESDSSFTPYEYEIGHTLTDQFLKENNPATALIGVNDMTALGIIGCLAEQGLRVPDDYSVCGFDNIFVSSVSIPSITTIEHHLHVRGQAAVDMILSKQSEQARRGPFIQIVPQVNKIEYEPQLLIRNSTGKCR